MAKSGQGRGRDAVGLLKLGFGLGLLVASSSLFACADPLPGFANPPPYDAGDPSDDASADDDAG